MPFAFGEGSSMLDSKVRKDSKVFMQPGATYVKDCVTGISNQGRSNGLLINTRSGAVLKPDIIVLCTGFKIPVFKPDLGVTLAEREAQLTQWRAKVMGAKKVLVAG